MLASPKIVYKTLYENFGPQGWWPIIENGGLKYRHGIYKARSDSEMFEICVGAILTQNTTWQNAQKALIGLNSKNIFSPFALSITSLKKICSAVRSSGYYNQKARCLNVFSKYIVSSYAASLGKFFLQSTNVCKNKLLALKGIGPETADSMLLYAGAKRIFVVDAYTKRAGSRFGWFNFSGYGAVQGFFENSLPKSVKVYNEFHALIVELCKRYCKKKPLCALCVLKNICAKKVI